MPDSTPRGRRVLSCLHVQALLFNFPCSSCIPKDITLCLPYIWKTAVIVTRVVKSQISAPLVAGNTKQRCSFFESLHYWDLQASKDKVQHLQCHTYFIRTHSILLAHSFASAHYWIPVLCISLSSSLLAPSILVLLLKILFQINASCSLSSQFL